MEKTLYLVDVSSFIFRAFFAIRPLSSRSGEPVNAVYGVATMLQRLYEEAHPEYLCVTYDSKEPSFRKEMYEDYKANRSAPPEDLVPQFDRIDELISAMKFPSVRQSGVEADDLIGSLAKQWTAKGPQYKVVIVSSDKDLMQLVDDRISVWDTMSGKRYGPDEVVEKFGVPPEQIRDYLGMVGDSSDNIPGIPSVGPKTAADLLKAHGSLKGALKAARAGEISGKKAAVLIEHEKVALLSAELATVKTDLKVKISDEELTYRFSYDETLDDFLKALDFNSLRERWPKIAGIKSGALEGPKKTTEDSSENALGKFVTIDTDEKLEQLLKKLEKTQEFGFDLETTSLNPRVAEIVGIALALDTHTGYYLPVGHRLPGAQQLDREKTLKKLKPFLENPQFKKVGQNLKYDWSVLLEQGIEADGIGADTMIAAYVLDPEGRHNLKTLAAKYLDYNVLTYEEVCGAGATQVTFDQIDIATATRYSAEDAWIAMVLWHKLKPLLEDAKLIPVFAQIDLPLVPVLTRMECTGVRIDVSYLKKLSEEFDKEIKEIENRVRSYSKVPLNLNSPKQLAVLLFEELKLPVQSKTKTGPSTDASVLDALSPLHEVPRLLLNFREIAKLKGTYVDPLPDLCDAKDHRIHTSYHQTVAATGRLSSSDPNLQNIPTRTERGKRIRRAFIPSEGCVLLGADYSQIELRLLAHMSGDDELIRSFNADEDIHRRTASEIYQVKVDQVSDEQRGVAKAINFGLMYGKTPFGLAQELKISRTEAQSIISRYFERYSGVKKYLDGSIETARNTGAVSTVMGRRRPLNDIRSKNPAIRNNAERMAMNSPIQGTAADLMKLAMIEIDHRLRTEKWNGKHYRSKMILQVHDEVIVDCPHDEVEAVKKLVVESMEGAMKLSVPLKVNAAVGSNWMEI